MMIAADRKRGRVYHSAECYHAHRRRLGEERRAAAAAAATRWCTVCGQEKPRDAYLSPTHPACTECIRERDRKTYLATRDPTVIEETKRAIRRADLRRKFGVTPEEVDALLAEQEGRCAGCRRELPEGKGRHLDHNHETGKVRGWLCFPCNYALGLLRDDPKTLLRLVDYVHRPGIGAGPTKLKPGPRPRSERDRDG